jgi:hypothetical protein
LNFLFFGLVLIVEHGYLVLLQLLVLAGLDHVLVCVGLVSGLPEGVGDGLF